MPSEIIFIFKAMHIIGVHNFRAGGKTRDRLMKFCDDALEGVSTSYLNYQLTKWIFWVRLIMFEKCFWLFRHIFGFMEFKFDEQNKLIS